MSDQLHPSAERVLLTIARYWDERGIPPTVRELAEFVGMRSTSSVQYWLDELAEDGLVRWDKRIARSLRLTPRGTEHIRLKEGAS